MSYASLQKEFPLQPIHNEAELDAATKMIDRLLASNLSKGEERYLDQLADFVWEYENCHVSIGIPPQPAKYPAGEFMQLAMDGKIALDKIDDYVDSWHLSSDGACSPRLWEYLGMTPTEYQRWVVSDKALRSIVDERRAVLIMTSTLPDGYTGRWWRRGDVYRPDPQNEHRLNFFVRWRLWLTGWRSAHWPAPHRKWMALTAKD